MDPTTFTIAPPEKDRPGRKSRTFSTRLLGYLTANAFWETPRSGDALRPVWIAYLGTDREAHPFTANLRGGAKAKAGAQTFQLPRRAPYRWQVQRVPQGAITVAYLPELFHLEPASPCAENARFILAPPRRWIESQATDLARDFGDDAPDAARAALFCAFLDRRTALPLVHDLRFHLRLYRAALETEWVYHAPPDRRPGEPRILDGRGHDACGLDAPLAVSVDASTLAQFLIEQTSLYHQEELRHGPTRIAADRRLFPFPDLASRELRLDAAVA